MPCPFQSLLSFVPGGRDNAVFIQKRAFETLATREQDGFYYLHPAAIAACFEVDPSNTPETTEELKEKMVMEAENDQTQGQALFARMREAATWEAPPVVQETLVDQIQDVASMLSAIRQPTTVTSKSESSSNATVEIGLSELDPAEEEKASHKTNKYHEKGGSHQHYTVDNPFFHSRRPNSQSKATKRRESGRHTSVGIELSGFGAAEEEKGGDVTDDVSITEVYPSGSGRADRDQEMGGSDLLPTVDNPFFQGRKGKQ